MVGVVVNETTIDTTMAVESVTANSRNEPADDAAHHENRNENGDQRHADRKHREPDLLRALQRRRKGLHSQFQVARDVLHHHDGIVHHETQSRS